MPSSSTSAKRVGGGAPVVVEVAPLKSKHRDTLNDNKYQTLATMNNHTISTTETSAATKLAANQSYQNYHQQQPLSAAAMMTNYHQQQRHQLHNMQQQHLHHNHPYPLGSQTISRSSNLHKQLYANPRGSIYAQQQAAAAAAAASGYFFYDQPNYQAAMFPNHLNQQLQQQHQHFHHQRVPYAPMSLAVRSPKQRAPIPLSPLMAGYPTLTGAHLTRTLGRPSSYHAKESQYQQQPQLAAPTARLIYQEPNVKLLSSHLDQQARLNKPLCRCRVMYLGSSVPHITKNGLHGIQEPLRHLYPDEQFNANNLRTSTTSSAGSTTSGGGGGGAGCSGPVTKISNTIDISHLSSSLGIDSWLSVWSNGLLLENVDEFGREMRRFYTIESLHYCAAVRFFDTATLAKQNSPPGQATATQQQQQQQPNGPNSSPRDDNNNNCSEISNNNNNSNSNGTAIKSDANNNNISGHSDASGYTIADNGSNGFTSKRGVVRFLPLDAPIFQYPGMLDTNQPPVFAAIMRRTSGIKVLECHAFICRRDAAANALVRCCTHAYSDFLNAKRLSADFGLLQQQQLSAYIGNSGTNAFVHPSHNNSHHHQDRTRTMPSGAAGRHFRSTSAGRHVERHQQLQQQRPSTGVQQDQGQYQVIDAAVVVHHNQAGAASRSRKGQVMADGRSHHKQQQPPHRGANNSTGTNSNELTHSDDNDLNDSCDDSGDDDEDEDNYAIITKHKQQHQKQPQVETQPVFAKRAGGRENKTRVEAKRSSKSRTKTVKGSSKSLFDDFMPPQPASLAPPESSTGGGSGVHEAAIERLSHSLDYLQMIANKSGAGARKDSRHATHSKKSFEAHVTHGQREPSLGGGGTTDTTMTVMSNKRHSKSMQDLQRIRPHESATAGMGSQHELADGYPSLPIDPTTTAAGSLGPKFDSDVVRVGKQRKATSYQDILRVQPPPPPPPPPCESPPPSSFNSLARRKHSSRNSSARSSLASSQTRSRRTSRHRARSGGASASAGLEARQQGSAISLSDANNCIYATCVGETNGATAGDLSVNGNEIHSGDLRVLKPEYFPTAAALNGVTSQPNGERLSSSGHKSRSRRKSQQPTDEGPLIDGHYYAPNQSLTSAPDHDVPLYAASSLCSPRPAQHHPQAPIYMPAYYMPPDPHPHQSLPFQMPMQAQQGPSIYGPGSSSLYDAITPPPGGPYLSLPYNSVQSSYHHQTAPQFNPMAVHQHHSMLAPSHQSEPFQELETGLANKKGSISGGGRKSKSSSKSSKTTASKLATKFRCLSPPLSFFSSSSPNGTRPLHEPRASQETSAAAANATLRPSSSGGSQSMEPMSALEAQAKSSTSSDSRAVNKRQQQQQQRQSVASNDREPGHADGSSASSSGLVSPSDIVSGRPGFVSQLFGSSDVAQSANATSTAAKTVAGVPTTKQRDAKAPRMSWIKRLSMSLGSSGAGSGSRDVVAIDPSYGHNESLGHDDEPEFDRSLPPLNGSQSNVTSPPLDANEQGVRVTELSAEAETARPGDATELVVHESGTSDLNNNYNSSNSNSDSNQNGGQQIIESPMQLSELPSESSAPSRSGGPTRGHSGSEEQKSKRKKGGLFSGVLTLGRSSGAKQARDKKAAEAAGLTT